MRKKTNDEVKKELSKYGYVLLSDYMTLQKENPSSWDVSSQELQSNALV